MASILVIDDEPVIRSLLRTVLERAGHTVTEATNGREGLALYRQQPADLVVTEIYMPELNGLDVILELTRDFLNVKVIAISGAQGEQKSVLNAAKLLGVRQTFQKPVRLEKFLTAVEYELVH
ncbi:MAG: response regulator [Nitrospirae bacterium]|nr:response regulator [Nitrospirota bacterium]MBU6482455.1 response regulator [Nitrospirota bacterium]MDE3041583.1 response regulator [Nitrospirota bacterium]MDE3219640.1 response regulator [Nitrospirota bacterium]